MERTARARIAHATPAASPREPEGYSHEEFMAISGLAPLPPIKGNAPLVAPIEYARAVSAIGACINLDEAKTWANKAEALAAWARMYGDDQISTEARRLKLHAYRRMAALADDLLPQWRAAHVGQRGRITSVAVLAGHGLAHPMARTVYGVGQLSDAKFGKAVNAANPPTPHTLVTIDSAKSPGWERVKRAMSVLQTICGHHAPKALAKSMVPKDRDRARIMIAKLRAWLNALESAL